MLYGENSLIAIAMQLQDRSDPLVLLVMVVVLLVEPGVPAQRLLHRLLLELLADDGDEATERGAHLGAVGYLVVGPAVEAQEREEGLALALHAAGLPVLAEREEHRRRLQERRPRRPGELLRLRRRGLLALGGGGRRQWRTAAASARERRRRGGRGAQGGGRGEGERACRERGRADERRAAGGHDGAGAHGRRDGGEVPRLDGVVGGGDGEPRRGRAHAGLPHDRGRRRRLEPQRRRPRVRRERGVLQRVLEVERAHHRRRRRQLHERPHSLHAAERTCMPLLRSWLLTAMLIAERARQKGNGSAYLPEDGEERRRVDDEGAVEAAGVVVGDDLERAHEQVEERRRRAEKACTAKEIRMVSSESQPVNPTHSTYFSGFPHPLNPCGSHGTHFPTASSQSFFLLLLPVSFKTAPAGSELLPTSMAPASPKAAAVPATVQAQAAYPTQPKAFVRSRPRDHATQRQRRGNATGPTRPETAGDPAHRWGV